MPESHDRPPCGGWVSPPLGRLPTLQPWVPCAQPVRFSVFLASLARAPVCQPRHRCVTNRCLMAEGGINVLASSLGCWAGALVAKSPPGQTPGTMPKGRRRLSLCGQEGGAPRDMGTHLPVGLGPPSCNRAESTPDLPAAGAKPVPTCLSTCWAWHVLPTCPQSHLGLKAPELGLPQAGAPRTICDRDRHVCFCLSRFCPS